MSYKRKPGPIRRTALADRSAGDRPSTNPLLRPHDNGTPTGPAANLKGRGKRPSADKGQNEWRTTSSHYRTAATHDRRWSVTVSALVTR